MTEERAAYRVPGGPSAIRDTTRLPFSDPAREAPTPEEIRTALRNAELTGSMAGELLGVSGRTIRKWTGGEREMPYSAWRLLLIETGQAIRSEGRAAD